MPKIKKSYEELQEEKRSYLENVEFEKQFMYVSALKTYPIMLICSVLSLILNLKILVIPDFTSETAMTFLNIMIKVLLLLGFFFFGIIAFANIIELKGKVMTWRELIILMLLTLIQGIFDGWVILGCILGIIAIITYVYFIQGRIESDE
jgi:predicted neutral ceramidase superfamily lipid hydrolase